MNNFIEINGFVVNLDCVDTVEIKLKDEGVVSFVVKMTSGVLHTTKDLNMQDACVFLSLALNIPVNASESVIKNPNYPLITIEKEASKKE